MKLIGHVPRVSWQLLVGPESVTSTCAVPPVCTALVPVSVSACVLAVGMMTANAAAARSLLKRGLLKRGLECGLKRVL